MFSSRPEDNVVWCDNCQAETRKPEERGWAVFNLPDGEVEHLCEECRRHEDILEVWIDQCVEYELPVDAC